MKELDQSIVLLLNQFAGRWPLLDWSVLTVATAGLFKAVPVVGVLLGYWFASAAPAVQRERRRRVILTIAGALLAMLVCRGVSAITPHRARPLNTASLNFQPPNGVSAREFNHLSSFPSDHAALMFALAAGIFFLNRRLGFAALVFVVCTNGVDRVYLGLHWPTDVLAGAVIGVLCVLVFALPLLARTVSEPALRWLDEHPGIFHVAMLFVMLQFSTMFDEIQSTLGGLLHLIKHGTG